MKKHNDQILKDVLKDMVDTYKLKPKLNQLKVRQVWEEQMGPSITNYTTEIYLRKNKLYITISSAPLKQELSYAKEKIISFLNEALAEEYIKEVIIR